MNMDRFTTNEYKALKQMYDSTVSLPDGFSYVPLSQADLARIIGVSANTMNKYFKYYIEDGFIEPIGKSKFKLTEKAKKLIKNFKG